MNFRFEQRVGASQPHVAAFFFDIKNLAHVSPPFPRLTIEAMDTAIVKDARLPITLDCGLFSARWLTVVEAVEQGSSFTDTTRGGVFDMWKHTHRFLASTDGTRIVDEIECTPRWWFFPFAWMFVHALFMVRRPAMERIFGPAGSGRDGIVTSPREAGS